MASARVFSDLGLPLDHVAIAVHSVAQASVAYELLGFRADGEEELISSQHVRVRTFNAGQSMIELLEPTAPQSPIARFLEKRGSGLHHLAFRVADIQATMTQLKLEGVPFLSDSPSSGRAGSRVVFIHPRWAQGVLLELVEHDS